MSRKKLANEAELNKKLKETVAGLTDALKELDDFQGGMDDALKDIVSESQIPVESMSKEVDKLWNASRSGSLFSKEFSDKYGDIDELTEDDFGTEPDEPEEYYISDTLKEIWDLVESTPNNMQLGKRVRQLHHKSVIEATLDSGEYPYNTEFGTGKTPEEMEAIDRKNQQMELFDSEEESNQLNLFDDTEE